MTAPVALPTVEQLAALPPELRPAVLAQLGGLTAALAAILATRPEVPRPTAPNDCLLTDVSEVARLIHRSPSWVRKHGHTLPGFHQPGGKGAKVAWRRSALRKWAGLAD